MIVQSAYLLVCICIRASLVSYSVTVASSQLDAITSTSASIPHVLTFCKHVRLYVLTLLPSGCSPQAPFRREALTQSGPREMFSPPTLGIPGHYYCQILLLTSLPERAFTSRSSLFFLSHQIHISLCDFPAFTDFEVQRCEH